jgi:hypothetical protein
VTTLHDEAGFGDIAELNRIVLRGPDRISQIEANLLGIHIKGSHEIHVANMVTTKYCVHESRDFDINCRIFVVRHALD